MQVVAALAQGRMHAHLQLGRGREAPSLLLQMQLLLSGPCRGTVLQQPARRRQPRDGRHAPRRTYCCRQHRWLLLGGWD